MLKLKVLGVRKDKRGSDDKNATTVPQRENLNLPKLLQSGTTKKIQPIGKSARLELPTGHKEVTKAIAMDCEMVGALKSGFFSLVARVSVVNSHGHAV